MKRWFVFAVTCVSSVAVAQPVVKVTGLSTTRWRIGSLDAMKHGTADDQLGFTRGVSTAKGDERARGPNAIAISGKTIWVVDGENERMLKLDTTQNKATKRPRPTVIKLAGARSIVSLVPVAQGVLGFDVARSKLVQIDKHNTTRELADRIDSFSSLSVAGERTVLLKSARKLMQIELQDEPAPPPQPTPPQPNKVLRVPMRINKSFVDKAFRGVPLARKLDGGVKLAAIDVKLTAGKARVAFLKGDKEERTVEMDAPVPGRLVSTTLLGTDKLQRSYYRLEVLVQEEPIKIERFIRILDAQGKQLEQITIPTEDVIVPEQDIAIGDDGSIAILLPYEDRTVIARLDPP